MKHDIKITLILIGVFVLAQLVGLVIVKQYVDIEKTVETGETEFKELPLGVERPPVEEQTSFIYILFAVLIGTGILLLLIKYKIQFIWKLWYFLAIFLTLAIAFAAFFNSLVAALLSLGITTWKVKKPNVYVHNISEVFIYGGLAAIFVPIMNVFSAIVLLLLISVYDMYAVWKSKHMITLAKFQSEQNMFAGFYVPYTTKSMKKSTSTSKKAKKVKMGKTRSAILGGGDVAFPLLFAGTLLKELGFFLSLITPFFVTLSLVGLLFLGKKNKFYPAMPFLTIGCLIGYGVTLLVLVI